MSPSGSIICSVKHSTYNYNFIIKNTSQDQPNEQSYKARSGRVPNTASMPLPHRIMTLPLSKHPCVHQPGSSPEPGSRVFIRVSLCRHNSLKSLTTWLNSISSPPPLPGGWYHPAQSPNPPITRLAFPAWSPSPRVKLHQNSGVAWVIHHEQQRNSYPLENSKDLEAPSKKSRTKTKLFIIQCGMGRNGEIQTFILKILILKAGDNLSPESPCVPH